MRVPHSPRRPLAFLVVALTMTVLAGRAATAQVVLGLPDETTAPAARPLASPALREAMTAIRKLVLDNHSLVTHRRLSPDQARSFAADIKRHATALEVGTDASALSEIVTPLTDGATSIAETGSATSQLAGLEKIETALARYPQLFDDPDWKPLR